MVQKLFPILHVYILCLLIFSFYMFDHCIVLFHEQKVMERHEGYESVFV